MMFIADRVNEREKERERENVCNHGNDALSFIFSNHPLNFVKIKNKLFGSCNNTYESNIYTSIFQIDNDTDNIIAICFVRIKY